MGFTAQAALATDIGFRDRVRVALVTAGVQIMGEEKAAYSDAEYGKRQALAFQVLTSAGAGMLEAFVWAAVQNPSITGASLDADIQSQVFVAWDDLAGVRIDD